MQYIDDYAAKSYDGYTIKAFLLANPDYAIYITGLYLAFVFYCPKYINKYIYGNKEAQRAGGKPAWLRYPWIFWNFLLSAFSFYGAWHMVPAFLGHIRDDGLRNAVCVLHEDEYYRGPIGMAVGLFALSKGPEFVDTFFILMSGRRNLPVLQWFHHSTTFLYAWHAYAVGSCALNFAAALNYSVHTIMYFYFALAEMGFKSLVRPFAMYITLMQIIQMVIGMYLSGIIFQQKYEDIKAGRPDSDPAACAGTSWDAARVQMLIAAANFILFSEMFVGAYIRKKTRTAVAPVAAPVKKAN